LSRRPGRAARRPHAAAAGRGEARALRVAARRRSLARAVPPVVSSGRAVGRDLARGRAQLPCLGPGAPLVGGDAVGALDARRVPRAAGSAMSWTFVAHVHTRCSFDSLTDPESLARHAAELGIDVLAVTDHGTWPGAGGPRGAAARPGLPPAVILASEGATEQGDVIGLFLRRALQESDAPALCDAIHADGGLVLLPHPYKWHTLDEPLLSRVDLIEVH